MARVLPILVACLLAFPVWAENASTFLDFGGDSFRAGRTVSHDRPETDDLFMAGETVLGQTNVGGTAHLAGREVTMEGDVGGDAYAAGEEITFRGSISGDATLVGREVSVALVGGDLRVAGSRLRLAGDIGGYAMVAGEDIAFDAAVAGDVSLAAKSVDWGEAASIAGRLVVYEEEPGELRVPERVVPADRIERRHLEEWEGPRRPNFGRAIAAFLLGVITVAAVAALIASCLSGWPRCGDRYCRDHSTRCGWAS